MSEERDPVDLLCERFLARHRAGDPVTVEQFAREHELHGEALREVLPALLLLERQKQTGTATASGGRRRLELPALERLGDFRIVREVGRGGMGVVFEAVQESLGRRVALKVLPQSHRLQGKELERFRREAQIAASLHHSHIVPVFGSGESDGLHYYAMQFIDGRGLDQHIAALQQQPPAGDALQVHWRRAARVGAQVAAALHHAHSVGTLHRDIKPSNVLLDQHDHAWITDFGLAKALHDDNLTQSGDVLGTLQYMAPEQFDGVHDARSEVYSLGATLYELVAMRPAFRSRTRSELIDLIRRGRVAAIDAHVPAVPRDLAVIVGKAMACLPGDRYASAGALADDLERFLADRPILARPHGALDQLLRWCRRNRLAAASAAAAMCALLVAAVMGWFAYVSTDRLLQQEQQAAQDLQLANSRTEGNLSLTLSAFEELFDEIIGPDPFLAYDEDPDTGDLTTELRSAVTARDLELLQGMLRFYDRFAERNRDSIPLRQQTARAWRRVGTIQVRLRDYEAAEQALLRAASLLRELGDADVPVQLAGVNLDLAEVELQRGRQGRAKAQEYCQSALRGLEVAMGASRAHRFTTARAHYVTVVASGWQEPGRGAGRERPPPRREGPPGRQPRPDQAAELKHLEQCRELLRGLLAEDPDGADYQHLLARCLLLTARLGGNEAQFQEAVALFENLIAAHPRDRSYRWELVNACLGPVGRRGGERAVSRAQLALTHAEALHRAQPTDRDVRAVLAMARARVGVADRSDRGIELLQEAAAEFAALRNEGGAEGRGDNRAVVRLQVEESLTLMQLVLRLQQRGDRDAAVGALRAWAERGSGELLRGRGLPEPERLQLAKLLREAGFVEAARRLEEPPRDR